MTGAKIGNNAKNGTISTRTNAGFSHCSLGCVFEP